MDILWKSLGGMIAVISFGIILHVPKKFLIWTGLNGALGAGIYVFVVEQTGSVVLGSFLGAVVMSVLAHIFARIFKSPVTIFLIPANLTLVPGAGMYRIVYFILQSDHSMAAYYFEQTFMIAGAIVVAMFIVNATMGNFITGVQNIKKGIRKERGI